MREPGIWTVGYVPRGQKALADERYDDIRYTDAEDFSMLEPLEAWHDVVAAGSPPRP